MQEATYTLNPERTAITCRVCGRTSHNANDVTELYCGECHRFHQRHLADYYPLLCFRFPEIPWREPTLVTVAGETPRYVCRICIARDGLSFCDVHQWPATLEDFAVHLKEVHPLI